MMNMRRIAIVVMVVAWCGVAVAQSTADPCPGFKNPASFNTGSNEYFWSARVGERTYTSGNYNDTTTGTKVMSTCTGAPDIVGHTNITNTKYYSGTSDMVVTSCGYTFFDATNKRFMIIKQDDNETDEFTKADNGSGGIKRIPDGYQTSIRLGDMRSTGAATTSKTYSSSSSNQGSEALFYTMYVTPQNALIFINYAVVARKYPHSAYDAGEFLIRVVKQNDDGTWPNAPINDSLWYKVSAPKYGTGESLPTGWYDGKGATSGGSSWPCIHAYKPWTKVAINLNRYLYEHVRIEMYTSDCIYNADPIYAYICGDYQPMTIATSGCPSPESDVLDTLSAPEGMLSYSWFACKRGAVTDQQVNNMQYMDTVQFRQVFPLEGDTTYNRFTPRLSDFVTTTGDTASKQTFMCLMTSALDPNKPFTSKLYANVENRKPIIGMTYTNACTGTVTFSNKTRSYTSAGLDPDSTQWVIFTDTTYGTVLDTVWGDLTTYNFSQSGDYGVILSCTNQADNNGSECMASKRYTIHAKRNPKATFELSDIELCEGDQLVMKATEETRVQTNIHYQWKVDGEAFGTDTADVHGVLPVGSHVVSLTTTNADSCTSTTMQTVHVYGQPTIGLSTDISAICLGDSVTLTAAGTSEYTWTSSPFDPVLDSVGDQASIVVSPTETTVYSLIPPGNNPCHVDIADVRIEVVPYPIPTIRTTGLVNKEDGKLPLEDVSPYAASSLWTFSDGSTEEGNRITHSFEYLNTDSVSVTLHTCNKLDCCADTTVSYPVVVTTVWFANTFTPDEETNNTFGIITTLPLIRDRSKTCPPRVRSCDRKCTCQPGALMPSM